MKPNTYAAAMADPLTEPDQLTKPPPSKPPPKTTSSWGTLEELLLACAVNRHGSDSWDVVAKELNSRSPPSLFTPTFCRQRYIDLKHRFAATADDPSDEDDMAVWLDELRRLRVAELKRELQRYDVSIVSLQLKVKRLRKERERSIKEEDVEKCEIEESNNSDLKGNEERENEPSENRRRIDDSVNVSNFTDPKIEPVYEPVEIERNRIGESGKTDDSCNGSSNSKEADGKEEVRAEREWLVNSCEVGESVAESRRDEEEGGVKENSDVQSTASLFSGREKKVSCSISGEENQSLGSKSGGGCGKGKCETQPLVDFLNTVRAKPVGSVFAQRLEIQETPRYKSLIKEHIDLEIIQKRLRVGYYTDFHTKLYRDLMLLISNAILFFSKHSSQHKAAIQLRSLVTKHFDSHLCVIKTQPSNSNPPLAPPQSPKPDLDHTDLNPKLGKTGLLIACQKRSSIVGRYSSIEAGKESAMVTPPVSVKSGEAEVLKQEGEKSSPNLFSAVTKKRSRDLNFGSRSSSSKNNNNSGNRSSRPTSSPTQKPGSKTSVSSRSAPAEAKADTKKPSLGKNTTKMRQGLRPHKDLLLDVLTNAEKRKICNSGANARSETRKESANQTSKEKDKSKKGRESPGSQNLGQPSKRAPAGKRGREATGETVKSKKRQRR